MSATSNGLRTWISKLVTLAEERQILASAVVLLAFVLVTGDWSLAGYIVMFGLFAIAYNFCLGRTGILTFGHAAFFGLGAYGYGLFVVHTGVGPWGAWIGVVLGVIMAAIGGLAIGALAVRLSGTYLALLTLAIAQAMWFVAFQARSWTGGDDGLLGIERPAVEIPGIYEVDLADPTMFFLFGLVILVLSMTALNHIQNSHFGRVLVAIRENENRAKYLGYDTYRYKLGSFVVSAGFSGLAGVLYPILLSIVSLQTLHWLLSGEVNFWVILGGLNTFAGPILGTGVYLTLRDAATQLTDSWKIPVGLLIILIVLYAPEGILLKIKEKLPGAER
jgi:branched-chain amino acid transport system permease protein